MIQNYFQTCIYLAKYLDTLVKLFFPHIFKYKSTFSIKNLIFFLSHLNSIVELCGLAFSSIADKNALSNPVAYNLNQSREAEQRRRMRREAIISGKVRSGCGWRRDA